MHRRKQKPPETKKLLSPFQVQTEFPSSTAAIRAENRRNVQPSSDSVHRRPLSSTVIHCHPQSSAVVCFPGAFSIKGEEVRNGVISSAQLQARGCLKATIEGRIGLIFRLERHPSVPGGPAGILSIRRRWHFVRFCGGKSWKIPLQFALIVSSMQAVPSEAVRYESQATSSSA